MLLLVGVGLGNIEVLRIEENLALFQVLLERNALLHAFYADVVVQPFPVQQDLGFLVIEQFLERDVVRLGVEFIRLHDFQISPKTLRNI